MDKPTPTPADVAKLTANKTSDAPGTTEQPANQESPTPDTKPEELTREQLLKELASVRREAANYRTQRNELKPLAEKYQAAEEAKKTELENKPGSEIELGAKSIKPIKAVVGLEFSMETVHANPANVMDMLSEELSEALARQIDQAILHGSEV